MTIVVFRDGVMAADSGAWAGDASYAPVRKVGRGETGNLYGCAGSAGSVSKFFSWVDAGEIGDMPMPVSLGDGNNNFIALIWRPGLGLSLLGGDGEEDLSLVPYMAIGAGSPAAFGAMFAGADAVTAVEATIAHGMNAIGPVQEAR